jgi:heme exporter protein D
MPQPHDYSAYIWPAYGLTALVWAILIGSSVAHARRWRKRAEQLSSK